MKVSRRAALFPILFALSIEAAEPDHRPLDLRSPLQDKNFYLLSAIERTPAAHEAFKKDAILAKMAAERLTPKTCAMDLDCNTAGFRWTDEQIDEAGKALAALYKSSPPIRALADVSLRTSGMYIRYQDLSGPELLQRAWSDCMRGINLAIDVYGLGKQARFANSDSISFDPKLDTYKRMIQYTAAIVRDDPMNLDLAYSSSLRFALEVMLLSNRDEAGRFEPMDKGENAAAMRRVKSIDWARYPYSVIVVPGSGNDRPGVRLSPYSKLRDELAVRRYRDGKAPFILVSGGFVHPNQTEFSEAMEMKRDLITRFGIPESAIIVDPHARHTTTNMRNAARLLYRYGIPFDKKAMVTTDPSQSGTIESPAFAQRCITQIGYVPYRLLGRVSPFDLEFLPLKDSLQANPIEPLDP